MSGFTKSAVIFGLIALAMYAAVTPLGVGWCTPFFGIALGLASGFVGSQFAQLDVSKTALIARGGLRAGLIVGVAGGVGQLIGAFVSTYDTIGLLLSLGCIAPIGIAVCGFFGWLGGWSWSRYNHERQTGYKPT